ncbi:MAG: hypothetical protein R3253_02690 [Longimicrobiales bacterium]|nr:hypothetical protein [Longimicrobiales bacterium]
MDTIFDLYFEDTLPEVVRAIAGKYLEAYSLFAGLGVWKGESENSAMLRVVGSSDMLATMREVAEEIRAGLKQEAVMLTVHKANTVMIGGS